MPQRAPRASTSADLMQYEPHIILPSGQLASVHVMLLLLASMAQVQAGVVALGGDGGQGG